MRQRQRGGPWLGPGRWGWGSNEAGQLDNAVPQGCRGRSKRKSNLKGMTGSTGLFFFFLALQSQWGEILLARVAVRPGQCGSVAECPLMNQKVIVQ